MPATPPDLLQLDRFSALVLVLLVGMGATVIAHAARSLRGEAYRRRFLGLATALVLAATAMAVTGNLVVLAIAWVATSALATQLIGTGPGADPRLPAVRARRSFALGDVALVAAVATLVAASGSSAIADIGAAGPVAAAAAGLLLVLAAATRGATAPFHRWLPDSLGAPTPSSALLHAGVVNGGAIVLLKLAPTVSGHLAPAIAATALGAASCVFAEAVMVTRPDVKGQLAWSTVAQMSFTLLLCGLGLEVAAALHLVAHGAYKGARFLSSGSSVRPLVRRRRAVPARSDRWAAALGLGVGLLAGAAGLGLARGLGIATELTANLAVPSALVVVACAVATTAWARRVIAAKAIAAGTTAIALATVAYLVATAGLDRALAPTFEGAGATLSPALLLPVLAALVGVSLRPVAGPRPPVLPPSAAADPTASLPLHVPALVHRSFQP